MLFGSGDRRAILSPNSMNNTLGYHTNSIIMKYLILPFLAILVIACQSTDKTIIVQKSDYGKFISPDKDEDSKLNADDEITFWQAKLVNQPDGFLYKQKLAASLVKSFDKTGEINLIHQSNNLLLESLKQVNGKSKSATLLSLSSNAVKLHQFQKALNYAFDAEKYTEEIYGPRLMQYDAMMELGMYQNALTTLESTGREKDFNYLVRMAKYKDHIGQLDQAIRLMEEALETVKNSNPDRWLWTKASLGDYYGHNGEIKKSYDTFMEVLKIDPSYSHALQGVAWIAFSHDKDPENALEIARFLEKQKELPDQKLFIAEIHEYLGHPKASDKWTNSFIEEAKDKKYSGMYNAYLVDLLADEHTDEAIELSSTEIDQRPVPQSYTLYAWSLYHDGSIDEAFSVLKQHVLGKTYEPALLYKAAVISAAAGQYDIAKDLINECKDAAFELGPIVEKQLESI